MDAPCVIRVQVRRHHLSTLTRTLNLQEPFLYQNGKEFELPRREVLHLYGQGLAPLQWCTRMKLSERLGGVQESNRGPVLILISVVVLVVLCVL